MTSVLNATNGDVKAEAKIFQQAEVEAKTVKQAAVKMVVEPIASTVFMSDSDEEAVVIAHEKYIRLFEKAGQEIQDKMTLTLNDGDVKAEAKGSKPQGWCRSRHRRPPQSKRRASRHSEPWLIPRNVLHQDKEKTDMSFEEFLHFLKEVCAEINERWSSTLNATDENVKPAEVEAKVVKQPAAKTVVEPMASTVFMSDSDEEAIVIAHEKYIRLFEKAGHEIQDTITLTLSDGHVKA